jgi:hypothetical protein
MALTCSRAAWCVSKGQQTWKLASQQLATIRSDTGLRAIECKSRAETQETETSLDQQVAQTHLEIAI